MAAPALHPGNATLSGDCAGVPQTRVCSGCGIEDVTYDRGRCPACSLHARLEHWRADGPPDVIARLEPHLTAREQSPNPLSVLQQLAKPAGITLGELTAGRVELSHEALDALDRSKSTEDLRAALVDHGLLAARDETLARMEPWIIRQLAALEPGPDTTTLRALATWKVGRDLAARRACGWPAAWSRSTHNRPRGSSASRRPISRSPQPRRMPAWART